MSVGQPAPSLTVQLVLFHTDAEHVKRTLRAHGACAAFGWREQTTSRYEVAIADCSPTPVLESGLLETIVAENESLADIRYTFLGENLGHGAAQNLLARESGSEVVIISNPDVIPDLRAVSQLVARLSEPAVGIAEAKQLPLEHPKAYHLTTGDMSWAAGSFIAVRRLEFLDLGGFDPLFFLHGDDVDLSWRYRARGYRIVAQPSAIVFHDKRLRDGALKPTDEEYFHAISSALLIRHRWGTLDDVEEILARLRESDQETERRVLAHYEERRAKGELPRRHEHAATVAEFHPDGNYAEHRYSL